MGLGGAALGGAIGGAIGTAILPGIGTAVGSAMGQFLGGGAGAGLGTWLVDAARNHEPSHQEQIRRERIRRRAERNRTTADPADGGENLLPHSATRRRRDRRGLRAAAVAQQIDQSDRSMHVTITGPIQAVNPEQLVDDLTDQVAVRLTEAQQRAVDSAIIDP